MECGGVEKKCVECGVVRMGYCGPLNAVELRYCGGMEWREGKDQSSLGK